MSFIKYNDDFMVEAMESGVKDSLGDKIYSYKVASKLPFNEVREFCMKELQLSYIINEKPNPFAPELIKFKFVCKISDDIGSIYNYKVKKLCTA